MWSHSEREARFLMPLNVRKIPGVADPSIIQDVNNTFDARYAALRPPRRELPGSARAQYRDFHVIEIEPDARVLSWDNARLMRQEDPTA